MELEEISKHTIELTVAVENLEKLMSKMDAKFDLYLSLQSAQQEKVLEQKYKIEQILKDLNGENGAFYKIRILEKTQVDFNTWKTKIIAYYTIASAIIATAISLLIKRYG